LPPARSFSRKGTPRKGPWAARRGLSPGALVVLVDDGIELRIEVFDQSDRSLDELFGRDLALWTSDARPSASWDAYSEGFMESLLRLECRAESLARRAMRESRPLCRVERPSPTAATSHRVDPGFRATLIRGPGPGWTMARITGFSSMVSPSAAWPRFGGRRGRWRSRVGSGSSPECSSSGWYTRFKSTRRSQMSRMREVEWESCLLEPIPAPELEQRFHRETGRPGSLMRFLRAPTG